eukprot:g1083.t1
MAGRDEEFWEGYYRDEDAKGKSPYDWFFDFEDVDKETWLKVLGEKKRGILHVGAGHSALPQQIFKAGWTNSVATDSSQTIVDSQKKRFPSVKYVCVDCRDMRKCFEDASFDVVVDKACLDALLCYEKSEHAVERMLDEAHRVLREGGTLVIFASKRASPCGTKGSAVVLPKVLARFGKDNVEESVLENPRRKGGICPDYDWHRVESYVLIVARKRGKVRGA